MDAAASPVVRCNFSLARLAEEAVAAAEGLQLKLEEWDSDVRAFDASHLDQALQADSEPEANSDASADASGEGDGLEAAEYVYLPGDASNWTPLPLAPRRTPRAPSSGPVRSARTHRRGKASSKKFMKKKQQKKSRAGTALARAQGDPRLARIWRVLTKWLSASNVYSSAAFSIQDDGSHTSTGWHGLPPPKSFREQVTEDYISGAIDAQVARLFRVQFTSGSPALLLDKDRRLFFYCSTPLEWLQEKAEEFYFAVMGLLEDSLNDPRVQKAHMNNVRGPHFPCIIGHYRQYMKSPHLTLWHKQNKEKADQFLSDPLIKRVTCWICGLVTLVFPGVAKRFLQSAHWHEKKYGIKPLFQLFWNLCINAVFPNQQRIHCLPHADSKNVVGVCVLLVYQVPGTNFNHQARTWLVLWEAGVVIQLPPWVVAIYPSSLLFHFNVDISDFKVVITATGEDPTPANSRSLDEGIDGRGSLVYFNEASMYQSSESGHETLEKAKAEGHSGRTDYGRDAKEAFTYYGKLIDIGTLPLSK